MAVTQRKTLKFSETALTSAVVVERSTFPRILCNYGENCARVLSLTAVKFSVCFFFGVPRICPPTRPLNFHSYNIVSHSALLIVPTIKLLISTNVQLSKYISFSGGSLDVDFTNVKFTVFLFTASVKKTK